MIRQTPKTTSWHVVAAALALALLGVSPARCASDVARGAYLVNAAATCAGCHAGEGPNGSLSGGRKFGGGPNAVFAPNITQDRETGIGAWSDAQIAEAVHHGARPDSSRIGPPMPQLAYRAMHDDDVRAIVAYLRTMPAVSHAVARSQRPAAPAPITR